MEQQKSYLAQIWLSVHNRSHLMEQQKGAVRPFSPMELRRVAAGCGEGDTVTLVIFSRFG